MFLIDNKPNKQRSEDLQNTCKDTFSHLRVNVDVREMVTQFII